MTTTKEFKTLHGLSDSAFNRLTNKIKAAYPDQELTRRINNRDWKIIDLALFEQYLTPQKVEASEIITGEIINHSSIQLLSADQCDELDRLAAIAGGMQVYKPAQIDLNGSQDEILSMLTVVASTVKGMEQTNIERKAALDARRQKLETAQTVLSHFATVGKGLESQAAAINDEAKDVGTVESNVKKQLEILLASLA